MNVILLFLDGVGIGRKDPEVNPFFQSSLPTLTSLLGRSLPHLQNKSITFRRARLVPVSATLGVAGLPQSGTGQTAIFTGVNAPKAVGKHFGPFPPTALRTTIEHHNIFRQLQQLGRSVSFTNAFPKQFFDYTNSGTRRLTVTTLSCMLSGVPLLTLEALRKNEAISADLTRARWPDPGYPEVPHVSPDEAGRHLGGIAKRNNFTLFEYWLTDHAGHGQDMKTAVEVLERFDAFLDGLISAVDRKSTLIMLISDHGNIEDLSTKSHTRNPVPCVVMGPDAERVAGRIKNLTHVTPTLLQYLQT